VKVQYFGDVNDYRKFALLRLLSEVGQFKIGVCWMLTPEDASGHGDKRSYQKQPEKWRSYDPPLFDALVRVPAPPTIKDLQRVESEALIQGATFFNDFAPDALKERRAYHARCMTVLGACGLVFLDPDNGLEVKSVPKGRKTSSKYAFLDEVADHYAGGRSVLVYQHFPRRVARQAFIGQTAGRLTSMLPQLAIWAFETQHVVFLLAATPDHVDRVRKAASTAQERGWVPDLYARVQAVHD
jgi:hypothetical protein